MSILKQPELFASEPSSALLGMGLLLAIAVAFVALTLFVALVHSPARKSEPEARPRRKKVVDQPDRVVCPNDCAALAGS